MVAYSSSLVKDKTSLSDSGSNVDDIVDMDNSILSVADDDEPLAAAAKVTATDCCVVWVSWHSVMHGTPGYSVSNNRPHLRTLYHDAA